VITDVSEEHTLSIFKAKEYAKQATSIFLQNTGKLLPDYT
jgi:hypothetical protein